MSSVTYSSQTIRADWAPEHYAIYDALFQTFPHMTSAESSVYISGKYIRIYTSDSASLFFYSPAVSFKVEGVDHNLVISNTLVTLCDLGRVVHVVPVI
jgi:hypothetical protein